MNFFNFFVPRRINMYTWSRYIVELLRIAFSQCIPIYDYYNMRCARHTKIYSKQNLFVSVSRNTENKLLLLLGCRYIFRLEIDLRPRQSITRKSFTWIRKLENCVERTLPMYYHDGTLEHPISNWRINPRAYMMHKVKLRRYNVQYLRNWCLLLILILALNVNGSE